MRVLNVPIVKNDQYLTLSFMYVVFRCCVETFQSGKWSYKNLAKKHAKVQHLKWYRNLSELNRRRRRMIRTRIRRARSGETYTYIHIHRVKRTQKKTHVPCVIQVNTAADVRGTTRCCCSFDASAQVADHYGEITDHNSELLHVFRTRMYSLDVCDTAQALDGINQ